MGLARRRFGWGYRNVDPMAGAPGRPAIIPGRKVNPGQVYQGFRLMDLFRSRKLGESPGQSTPENPGQSFTAQLRGLFAGPAGKWWIPTKWGKG